MMQKLKFLIFILSVTLAISSCKMPSSNEHLPQGKLYIIGGRKRPLEMVRQLIELSGVQNGSYIVVLPMSSADVDTAAYWAMKQFKDQGVTNITWFDFKKDEMITQSKLDSLAEAGMIYISGGDQNRFMDIVKGTPIVEAIHLAYSNGAIIAGTSAGAAVQSSKMITGNQLIDPEMRGYKTLQPNNIELAEGLGLLPNAIIDQHFIWRERMNRLISVCIENPNELAIGIDESTAIIVEGDSATVFGLSQVVVLNPYNSEVFSNDSLLSVKNIRLDVYLPGQSFSIKP